MNITRSKLTAFIMAFVMLFAVIFSFCFTPPETVFADSDYGTTATNSDGSVTLTFGENSLITGSGSSSTVTFKETTYSFIDNLKGSSDQAVLQLSDINLSSYDVNAVEILGANANTSSITVNVGDTTVATVSNIHTSGSNIWNTYRPFTALLTDTSATGTVTLTITCDGQYYGNYLSVRFYSCDTVYRNASELLGSKNYSLNGNSALPGTDENTYAFATDAPEEAKTVFAASDNNSNIDTSYTHYNVGYLGGYDADGESGTTTSSSVGDAITSISLKSGTYTFYIIGKDSNRAVNFQIDDGASTRNAVTNTYLESVTCGSAVAFGTSGSTTIYLQTATFELNQDVSNATLRLYNDSGWLPDTYEVVIVPYEPEYEDIIQIPQSEFANGSGNLENKAAPYTFMAAADDEPVIKTLLGGSLSATATSDDNELVKYYRNFIGCGTAYGNQYYNPYYSGLYLEAGTYTIYYIPQSASSNPGTFYFDIGTTDMTSATTSDYTMTQITSPIGTNDSTDLTLYKGTYTTETDLNDVTLTFIKGSWLPDMCSVVIVKNPGFGNSGFDSGVYYDSSDEQTYGVIRYLQEYTGTDELSDYGFYFIASDGSIITSNYISSGADLDESTYGGFYGDLYEIPESYCGSDNTYYAKPYVTISDSSTTLFGDSIGGYVNSEKTVTYPDDEAE